MPLRLRVLITTASVAAVLLSAGVLVQERRFQDQTKIVFLDVGQGDAILIEQGSFQVLIDSGRDGKQLLSELGRYVPFWDRQIEVIIPTHPDADHIGGFHDLFGAYQVQSVLWTGATSDTDFWRRFEADMKTDIPDNRRFIAVRGERLRFPYGGELTLEYPRRSLTVNPPAETNEGSIVSRFVYGETSFLLTGDLPSEERFLPEEPPVTVLKAGHHGSKYSTSNAFLGMVQPKEAVISVGENTYGHPSKEALDRLKIFGVKILRTDELGSIEYDCEGNICQRKTLKQGEKL